MRRKDGLVKVLEGLALRDRQHLLHVGEQRNRRLFKTALRRLHFAITRKQSVVKGLIVVFRILEK